MMARYRTRLAVVHAVQWQGQMSALDRLPPWAEGITVEHQEGGPLTIHSPEGDAVAALGDLIVLDAKGNLLPYKPDAFEERYQETIRYNPPFPFDEPPGVTGVETLL